MERKSARSTPRVLVYADELGTLRPIKETKEKTMSQKTLKINKC